MNKLFNSVRLTRPKSNMFDLSHEKKLSLNMGELVPIYLEEIVPGDKFKVKSEILLRMAPMISPVMHRVNVFTHYFFVPNRLVFANWENFITGGVDGLDVTPLPYILITEALRAQIAKGTLADYFGIAPPATGTIYSEPYINALPFRGYQLIYNEFYRDQTLNAVVALTKNDTVAAPEQVAITTLRNRCWEHDYFTSALPWTQRGGEVLLPNNPIYKDTTKVYKGIAGSGTPPADGTMDVVTGKTQMASGADNDVLIRYENIDGIEVTINDMRRASRLQAWLERNAIGGSRYIEQIMAHFGVKSSDGRLQRPQYLGGGKQAVVVSEVLNTSATTTEPQGNMAGHGISVGQTNQFRKGFEEHGYVIGIMSVLPRTTYQQGIPYQLRKSTKFQWYFPEFANIGEQPILNSELYHDYQNTVGTNYETFGYQSRYAEYKFGRDSVHGDFRDTLSYWHMGRIFTSKPDLNAAFVSSNPTHRVFAVTDPAYDKLYCQIYNDVKAIRLMPKFGEPGIHMF